MKHTSILLFITFFSFSNFFAQDYHLEELGRLDLRTIHSSGLNDIWGYVDEVGNEYAIVGLRDGTSVVDVTDPSNPVELFFEPGSNSLWRDIKTYGDYAYVTTEAKEGLLIIDLSPLPSSTSLTTTYLNPAGTINGDDLSAHNLYIDENGILYLFGANKGNKGAWMFDLTSDPLNPTEVGLVDDFYAHDGVAKNNTLYLANLSNGFNIYDVTDKANPVMLGNTPTPSNLSHNVWFSDDQNYAYHTDEVSGAYLVEYDVSDPTDIKETDRIRTTTGDNVIPHNTHFVNNYVVTSYYTDGVTIHDVSYKGNMIEVARFDTSPFFSGDGFNGCWGVYPWLPSGNIIASDMERGLYVLGPDYKRGCYLQGMVTDIATENPINNVAINIKTTPISDESTDFNGEYVTGYGVSGTYSVEFSHPDYPSKTIDNVVLSHGDTTFLNIQLGVVVSVTGNQALNLDVYPNPFTDELRINTLDTNLSINIVNALGEVVLEQAIVPGSPVSFPDSYAKGIYIVKIMKRDEVLLIKKMVKE